MKERFSEIDDMRGLAILAMVLIHTNAYFLSDKIAETLWNYSQFAVPVFLFCSSYIFFRNRPTHGVMLPFTYIKKRFMRLLIPYYIFAVIYILVSYFEEPAKITGQYILQSLFLVGGIDINWLILLFLFLTFLMPIFTYLEEKQKKLFF